MVGINRVLSCVAIAMVLSAAYACRSPYAIAVTGSEFPRQFAGSYAISRCTETGVFFSGLCAGSSSIA